MAPSDISEHLLSITEHLLCAGLVPGVWRQVIQGPAFRKLIVDDGAGWEEKANKEVISFLKGILQCVWRGEGGEMG